LVLKIEQLKAHYIFGRKNNFLFLDIDKFLIWKSKFRLLRPICKIPPEVHFQFSVPLNLFLNFNWKTKSSWPLGNGLPETELSSICVWTLSLTEKPASVKQHALKNVYNCLNTNIKLLLKWHLHRRENIICCHYCQQWRFEKIGEFLLLSHRSAKLEDPNCMCKQTFRDMWWSKIYI